MPMAALFMMQAAALPAPAIDFDLRKMAPESCAPARGDEIVVCAAPDLTAQHRLAPLPERAREPLLPKAAFGIVGDVKGAVETEAEEVAAGVVSNRIMVRVKIPF